MNFNAATLSGKAGADPKEPIEQSRGISTCTTCGERLAAPPPPTLDATGPHHPSAGSEGQCQECWDEGYGRPVTFAITDDGH
jgi:hypothetical protein